MTCHQACPSGAAKASDSALSDGSVRTCAAARSQLSAVTGPPIVVTIIVTICACAPARIASMGKPLSSAMRRRASAVSVAAFSACSVFVVMLRPFAVTVRCAAPVGAARRRFRISRRGSARGRAATAPAAQRGAPVRPAGRAGSGQGGDNPGHTPPKGGCPVCPTSASRRIFRDVCRLSRFVLNVPFVPRGHASHQMRLNVRAKALSFSSPTARLKVRRAVSSVMPSKSP